MSDYWNRMAKHLLAEYFDGMRARVLGPYTVVQNNTGRHFYLLALRP